jgi:hypothetical protein
MLVEFVYGQVIVFAFLRLSMDVNAEAVGVA